MTVRMKKYKNKINKDLEFKFLKLGNKLSNY